MEKKKGYGSEGFLNYKSLLPLSLSHSLSLSVICLLRLAAASTTFGGALAIGAPPSPLSNASAKSLPQRRRRRFQVGRRLPQGLRRRDLARGLDAEVDHGLGGVRDGVAAEGDVRAVVELFGLGVVRLGREREKR